MPGWRFAQSYAERQSAYEGKNRSLTSLSPNNNVQVPPIAIPIAPNAAAVAAARKAAMGMKPISRRYRKPGAASQKSKQVELMLGYPAKMECPAPPPNSYREGYVREAKVKFNPIPEILNKDEVLPDTETEPEPETQGYEYQPNYGQDDEEQFENFYSHFGITNPMRLSQVQGQGHNHGRGDFQMQSSQSQNYGLDSILQTRTLPAAAPQKYYGGKPVSNSKVNTTKPRNIIPSNFSVRPAPDLANFGPVLSVQAIRTCPMPMQTNKSKSQAMIDKYFEDMASTQTQTQKSVVQQLHRGRPNQQRAAAQSSSVDEIGGLGIVQGRQLFPQFRQGRRPYP